MRYIINDTTFDVDPKEWPSESTFAIMQEGDRYAREFKLNNSGMTSESIQLIINIITKDIENYKLSASDINWNDLLYTVNYLGLGVSVDFIYPLFLTIEDRIEWYRTCETRQTYICDYSGDPEDESKYVFGGVEETEQLERVHFNNMELRDSDYNIVGENAFSPAKSNRFAMRVEDSIFTILSYIPNLFVAGGYALEHIKEAVVICIEFSEMTKEQLSIRRTLYFPVRTRYSISVPIPIPIQSGIKPFYVHFILIKSRNKYQILNRFDIDASCIGFDIGSPSRFYALPRFIRAFETKTNIIDPTHQSHIYIKRLIKYAGRGYNIAVPGFDSNDIKLSPNILKLLTESTIEKRNNNIKDMNLIGLQNLVTSALARSNISMRQPATISGQFRDYDYAYYSLENIMIILRKLLSPGPDPDGLYLINKGLPIGFVVNDVLNEGSRPFKTEMDIEAVYVPKYPIIELMDDDPQNGGIGSIHQVRSSFYGEYYEAEMKRGLPIRISSPSITSFRPS